MEVCHSFRKKEKIKEIAEQSRTTSHKACSRGKHGASWKGGKPSFHPNLEWVPSSVSHMSSWKISD